MGWQGRPATGAGGGSGRDSGSTGRSSQPADTTRAGGPSPGPSRAPSPVATGITGALSDLITGQADDLLADAAGLLPSPMNHNKPANASSLVAAAMAAVAGFDDATPPGGGPTGGGGGGSDEHITEEEHDTATALLASLAAWEDEAADRYDPLDSARPDLAVNMGRVALEAILRNITIVVSTKLFGAFGNGEDPALEAPAPAPKPAEVANPAGSGKGVDAETAARINRQREEEKKKLAASKAPAPGPAAGPPGGRDKGARQTKPSMLSPLLIEARRKEAEKIERREAAKALKRAKQLERERASEERERDLMAKEEWNQQRVLWAKNWGGREGAWRTVRVFISSTFTDMHGERDSLTRSVFPALNNLCKSRRVRVVPVDLRWGLTSEDTSDEGLGALEHCLLEVGRHVIGAIALHTGWGERAHRTMHAHPPSPTPLHGRWTTPAPSSSVSGTTPAVPTRHAAPPGHKLVTITRTTSPRPPPPALFSCDLQCCTVSGTGGSLPTTACPTGPNLTGSRTTKMATPSPTWRYSTACCTRSTSPCTRSCTGATLLSWRKSRWTRPSGASSPSTTTATCVATSERVGGGLVVCQRMPLPRARFPAARGGGAARQAAA